jgi:putative transposase
VNLLGLSCRENSSFQHNHFSGGLPIHRLGPWKTMASVEWETLKWVDWFNNRRLLEPIHCSAGDACITERGYIPPAEAEERYYAQFDTLDMVA